MYEYFNGYDIYGDEIGLGDIYTDEKWWFIEGFPNYRISNMGRVWSYYSHWFLTPQVDSSGHLQVKLSNNGTWKLLLVHRLVAAAFIPNPHNFPEVRHLDDDPSNNVVANLAWGTQADNMMDASENGSFSDRETPIIAINLKNNIRLRFRSQHEAARKLNIDQGNIAHVLSGRVSSAGGFCFQYARERSC